ncbi:MAG: isoprenyl transferase [Clostridia bacterium]|nr:isoprenyl transferase [Clostridia bacterium]
MSWRRLWWQKQARRWRRGLDPHRLPRHVAIIMDGNGRWALRQGLPRVAGHRAGVETLRAIVESCIDIGIGVLTVYAFSTENWKRPREEVAALMDLLVEYLRRELPELKRNGVQIRAMGDLAPLPEAARQELQRAQEETRQEQKLVLNIAVNYGGRAELIRAARLIGEAVAKGALRPEEINEETFVRYLYTADLPDPDLIIRPSGEMRLSNFLLWQSAYSELWVTPTLWPDFTPADFWTALADYQQRHRRFGGLGHA